MVRLVECIMVDINSGFQNTVTAEVNETLIKLQDLGMEIVRVSQPLVNGRQVYLTVEYNDPNLKFEETPVEPIGEEDGTKSDN